jgi:hypothetical protein
VKCHFGQNKHHQLLIHYCLVFSNQQQSIYVGTEVVTAVAMKNSIFWDLMLCVQSAESQLTFGGIFRVEE